MNAYISINKHKYYLKVHLVFVCKYRKKLLANKQIDFKVKTIFKEIESKNDFQIDIMETDKDHIHLLFIYQNIFGRNTSSGQMDTSPVL